MRNLYRFTGAILLAAGFTGGLFALMTGLIHSELGNLGEKPDKLAFEINPKIEDVVIAAKKVKIKKLAKIETPPAAPIIERQKAGKPSMPITKEKGRIPDFKPIKIKPGRFELVIADTNATPIVRVPPIMPARASRSGHCKMEFDVGVDGKPFNVKALYCTESLFKRASIKSAEKWQYRPKIRNGQAVIRRGVRTTISFNLKDENGKIIPQRGI